MSASSSLLSSWSSPLLPLLRRIDLAGGSPGWLEHSIVRGESAGDRVRPVPRRTGPRRAPQGLRQPRHVRGCQRSRQRRQRVRFRRHTRWISSCSVVPGTAPEFGQRACSAASTDRGNCDGTACGAETHAGTAHQIEEPAPCEPVSRIASMRDPNMGKSSAQRSVVSLCPVKRTGRSAEQESGSRTAGCETAAQASQWQPQPPLTVGAALPSRTSRLGSQCGFSSLPPCVAGPTLSADTGTPLGRRGSRVGAKEIFLALAGEKKVGKTDCVVCGDAGNTVNRSHAQRGPCCERTTAGRHATRRALLLRGRDSRKRAIRPRQGTQPRPKAAGGNGTAAHACRACGPSPARPGTGTDPVPSQAQPGAGVRQRPAPRGRRLPGGRRREHGGELAVTADRARRPSLVW